jgi:hypothetical protein
VERLNGTLKQSLFKIFTIQNSDRWLNILDKVVENYNNTLHGGIKKTPNESFNSNTEQQQEQFTQATDFIYKLKYTKKLLSFQQ